MQVIEKQYNKYKLKINDTQCYFIPPYHLFVENNLLPLKPFVPKGKSVLKYLVNGKQVSYWQIKKALCRNKGL